MVVGNHPSKQNGSVIDKNGHVDSHSSEDGWTVMVTYNVFFICEYANTQKHMKNELQYEYFDHCIGI